MSQESSLWAYCCVFSIKKTDEYACIDSELVNEVPSIDDFDSSLRDCLILDDILTKTLNKFEKNN